MVAHAPIGEVIHRKVLFLASGQLSHYTIWFSADGHLSIQPHEVGAKEDILLVSSVEIALGQADVVDSIEYVGFAHPIGSYEAVYLARKVK